jgi:hypothetical protein
MESKNVETIGARQEKRGKHEHGNYKHKARGEGKTRMLKP